MGRGKQTLTAAKGAVAPAVAPTPAVLLRELQDLPPDDLAALEESLRPRRAANSGFLDRDEALLPLLAQDIAALAAVNLTPQQVADRLLGVLTPHYVTNYRRQDALRAKANVPDHIEVTLGGFTKGFQACPFADGPGCKHVPGTIKEGDAYGDADFRISNTRTGESIKGPGLLPHLASRHNFFEGHIRYRVDPVALARVLEMT